jgi:hypothetical protein
MDKYTELRAASAGNLTADETLSDFALTAMVKPLYLHTIVPQVPAGNSLKVNAVFKAGSTELKRDVSAAYSSAGHYVLEIFCDAPSLTKLSVTNDVASNGNFGAVVQYLSPARGG